MTNPEGNILQFASDGVDDGALKLVRMRGREAISELFEFELILANDGQEEPLSFAQIDELLGGQVSIEFAEGGGALCGVLRELETLPAVDLVTSHYRAVMVPRLWLATQIERSAIYQELALPDLLTLALERAGLAGAFELRLSGSYPKLEYVVQHRESDYNFIARLLEDAGLRYHFEHDAGGAGELLVISDSNAMAGEDASHDAMPYIPKLMETPEGGAMLSFASCHRVVATNVRARDYNYREPPHYLEGSFSGESGANVELSVTRYGGHFKDQDGATAYAERVGEALAAERVVYRGETTCAWLRSGHRVTVEDHSEGGVHFDYAQELLIRSVEHDWDENWLYRNTITALDVETEFRPRRVTPRPRVYGVLHGRVVGEQAGSKSPDLDESGRYLVQFLFPNAGDAGSTSISRRIRMLQPHMGASAADSYGVHFPLHAGTEVAVIHAGGDPDRPIIVGALANPMTPSPVTSANPFVNMIKTRSGIVMTFVDEE